VASYAKLQRGDEVVERYVIKEPCVPARTCLQAIQDGGDGPLARVLYAAAARPTRVECWCHSG